MNKKTIGIIGTRTRDSISDYNLVEKSFLEIYNEGDWICSGGCSKGGDRFAQRIAKKFGIPILIFYPNWKIGKGAGFIRNTEIAKQSNILIACVIADRRGGTEDTINKFIKKEEYLSHSKNSKENIIII